LIPGIASREGNTSAKSQRINAKSSERDDEECCDFFFDTRCCGGAAGTVDEEFDIPITTSSFDGGNRFSSSGCGCNRGCCKEWFRAGRDEVDDISTRMQKKSFWLLQF
jgi:hypothetical protein